MPTWAARRYFFRLPCSTKEIAAARMGSLVVTLTLLLSEIKGYRDSLVAIDVYNALHSLALTHEPMSRTDCLEVVICLCPLSEADT